MEKQDLLNWIENVFKRNYKNVKVDFENLSEKIDGHVGEVNFVVVKYQTNEGKQENKSVVVKTGKSNPVYREFLNTELLFRQEIIMYEKIFPLFERFQKERGIVKTISFPKCYATAITKNVEMIILVNLKTLGYDMNNRKIPLNAEHLKIILKFYAEFHAVSLALKDQKSTEFDNVIENLNDSLRNHLRNPMLPITKMILKNISSIFLDRNELELHLKVKKIVEKDKLEDVFPLFDLKLPYSVISHLDAWNNNIMYRYEDNNKIPTQVAVIDWQMAAVRNSPVYDILQLLYCSCSPEDLSKNWKTHLKLYHDFLSQFLQQLGSDPNIFTYSTLLDHWKQFSLYGLMFVPMVIKFMYLETEDVVGADENPNFEDTKRQYADAVIKDENYYNRIVGLFKFYFDQTAD